MIFRQAKDLQAEDVVRLRHSRYPQADFIVKSIEPDIFNGKPVLRAVLKQVNLDFGPTEFFMWNDYIEIVLS